MSKSVGAIDEVAAEWVVRLGSDQRTHADEEAFRAWLEQDPAHAQAYADCAVLWDAVGEFVSTSEAHTMLKPLRTPAPVERRFSRRVVVFGAVGTVLAVAAGLIGPLLMNGASTVQTAVGEQRRVQLADGSDVFLNTDTKLRVKLMATQRLIFLDRGQAFFEVAKDNNRPFRVFAGRTEVRALGTAFEVRRIGDGIQVTLEEGKVAIYRGEDGSSETLGAPTTTATSPDTSPSRGTSERLAVLTPGEQAVFKSKEPVAIGKVDLAKTQAWRYGRMILDNALLGDVIADLNRYGGVQIILADPRLAGIRVSGVFHTGRPEDFVESVTAAFPVKITRKDEQTIVLKSH
jgi:transmembrane sensor